MLYRNLCKERRVGQSTSTPPVSSSETRFATRADATIGQYKVKYMIYCCTCFIYDRSISNPLDRASSRVYFWNISPTPAIIRIPRRPLLLRCMVIYRTWVSGICAVMVLHLSGCSCVMDARVLQQYLVFAAKRDHVQPNQQTRFPRATRPLPLKLVTVGKDRGQAMESVAMEYVKKIQRYCAFEEVQLRPNPKNSSDVNTQVFSEGERVMRSISTKDWVVLLDERGKEMTSEKFADLIADAGETGASAVVFCIGGPFGHGPQVRERANVSVKLSTMVLNHQVAFLVLLEQIYRAWTILRGEKYHH